MHFVGYSLNLHENFGADFGTEGVSTPVLSGNDRGFFFPPFLLLVIKVLLEIIVFLAAQLMN